MEPDEVTRAIRRTARQIEKAGESKDYDRLIDLLATMEALTNHLTAQAHAASYELKNGT